jgi:hypothetical protein
LLKVCLRDENGRPAMGLIDILKEILILKNVLVKIDMAQSLNIWYVI